MHSRFTRLRTLITGVATVAALATSVPAVAASTHTVQRTGPAEPAGAAAGTSRYGDPCEGSIVDLRRVEIGPLTRSSALPTLVDVDVHLCAPVSQATVTLDLHARADTPGAVEIGERPAASLVVAATSTGGSWTWRAGATGSGPVIVDGTRMRLSVPACALAGALGGGCLPGTGIVTGLPATPSFGVRACTGARDCGPGWDQSPTGIVRTDAEPVQTADYLPEPDHRPVGYPAACQGVAGAGSVPQGVGSLRPAAAPPDPLYATTPLQLGQPGLGAVGAENAWDLTRAAGRRIAILDTGVDGAHPDLSGQVALSVDLVPRRSGRALVALPPGADTDLDGHGTFVASVAAARQDGQGMTGLAPSAQLLVARVVDAEGCVRDAAVARAIEWASAQGADVINISLAGTSESSVIRDAVASLGPTGPIVVAAAGNTFGGFSGYPAQDPGVLGVTASVPQAVGAPLLAPYAAASGVTLAAPGGSTTIGMLGACNTASGDSWCRAHGTSYAAPVTSAAAALVRAIDPARTVPGIDDLLRQTATPLVDAGGIRQIAAGSAVQILAARTNPLRLVATTDDPVEMSVGASQAGLDVASATGAVLARSDSFADALAGAPLASRLRGPLLLTSSDRLDSRVRDELARAVAPGSTVYLVGGEDALSPAVAAAISELRLPTVRVAGPDRVATSIAAARHVRVPGAPVYLVPSHRWPDASSATLHAAETQGTVLLVPPTGLTAELLDTIRVLAPPTVHVVGGEQVLPAGTETLVTGVLPGARVARIAGTDRYETAARAAAELWGRRQGAPTDNWVVVHAERPHAWAAALVGAPLAARYDAPLLLVRDGVGPVPTRLLRDQLRYRIPAPATGFAIGYLGTSTAADTYTRQRLRELLGG